MATFPSSTRRLSSVFALLAIASIAMARPHTAPRKSAPPAKRPNEQALALQVALDKAGFSPGEIDGRPGAFTTRALDAFKAAHGLAGASGAIDQATIAALGDAYREAAHEVHDHARPTSRARSRSTSRRTWSRRPNCKTLGYTSALEELAERFHAKPDLLTRLNPNAQLAAGTIITVPAVDPMQISHAPGRTPSRRDAATRRPRRSRSRRRAARRW